MKENVKKQFEQFYRMFGNIVNDYDEYSWNNIGHELTTPSKLAFHIIQSTKYYSSDITDTIGNNGIQYSCDYKIDSNFKFTRENVLENTELQKKYLSKWIDELDINATNTKYKWTGNDMESVVIFIIRHSYFHLGELNALLNEYKEGKAADHFAQNIW